MLDNPHFHGQLFAMFAQLAMMLAGVALIVQAKRLAAKLFFTGILFAVTAAIAPAVLG